MATEPTPPPTPTPSADLGPRAAYANLPIRQNIGEIQNGIADLPINANGDYIMAIKNSLYTGTDKDPKFNVGIIGAGSAGLFTAMIFDHLKETYGLDVTYEILEASKVEGGRLYSYEFPKAQKQGEAKCSHDYYDVGAMRFPDIDIMERTFALFKLLGMDKIKTKLDVCYKNETFNDPLDLDKDKGMSKDAKNAEAGTLIPYYLSSEKTPNMYNDIRMVGSKHSAKDFGIRGLPYDIENILDPEEPINREIRSFKEAYDKGQTKFWDNLMKRGDRYSVRQYLNTEIQYDYNTIEFLEAMNFGNRWYDQAFSEMVIDNLEFDGTKPWWCVMGGAQEIAKRMAKALKQQNHIKFQKKVTKIAYNDAEKTTDECVTVTVQGEENKPRTYHGVFNSATLGAQQHMDLNGLQLNYGTKQAIRSLGYGASCKVGIRFKRLWWREAPFNINRGGVAHTDRSIRACVYPSYNLYDDIEKPGVLLASYTWSQEAERIGALINRKSRDDEAERKSLDDKAELKCPDDEAELKELLINDLARLHADQKDLGSYDRVHDLIKDNYIGHYAYNWYADPLTVGAFAFFGPGQFQNMWQWITRTDGNYMIIGEASSSHHAWVVGALESAVRAVYQFLYKHSMYSAKVDKILKAYVEPALLADSKTENPAAVKFPFGPVPHEFDRTREVEYPSGVTKDDASSLAELARHQVFIETVRQELVNKGVGGDQLDPKLVTKEQVDAFPFVVGSTK